MPREKTSVKWIETGYSLFAHDGLEGIHIEKIARALDLNKSSFYHFFGTLEVFHEQLVLHHYNMIDLAMKDGEGAQSLDPDTSQDGNHKVALWTGTLPTQSIPFFQSLFARHKKIENRILLWKASWRFDNDSFSLLCLSFVRDTFYSRVSFETFNYHFLHELAAEAKKVVDKIKEGSISLNRIDPNADLNAPI